jgi:hypothetical protein
VARSTPSSNRSSRRLPAWVVAQVARVGPREGRRAGCMRGSARRSNACRLRTRTTRLHAASLARAVVKGANGQPRESLATRDVLVRNRPAFSRLASMMCEREVVRVCGRRGIARRSEPPQQTHRTQRSAADAREMQGSLRPPVSGRSHREMIARGLRDSQCMRPRILALAIALGSMTVSACDTATDPIIGRSPSRDTTTDSSGAPGAAFNRGVGATGSHVLPSQLASAIR